MSIRGLIILVLVAGSVAGQGLVAEIAGAQGYQGRWKGTIEINSSGTRTYKQYYRGNEGNEQTYGSSRHTLHYRVRLNAPGYWDPVESALHFYVEENSNGVFEFFRWSGGASGLGYSDSGECTATSSGTFTEPIVGGVRVSPGWLGRPVIETDATGQVSMTYSPGCRFGFPIGFRPPDPFDRLALGPPEDPEQLGNQTTLCADAFDHGPENLADKVTMVDGRPTLRVTGQMNCSGRHEHGFGDSNLPQDDVIDITYAYDLVLEPECQAGDVQRLTVGRAIAVGCFTPAGGDRYETNQGFQVGGIDVTPTERVAVDTSIGTFAGSGAVDLGGVRLPISPDRLPTRRETWDLTLSTAKAGAALLKGMPVSGSLKGKWIEGGEGLEASASVDIEALAARSGVDAVVTGSYVSRPGGSFSFRARNGEGADLTGAEVRIGEVSLLPRAWTRLSRRISLRDVKLGYRDDGGVDEWSGAATLGLPIYRSGTPVTLAGRLTVRDGSFAGGGATVDNLNIPGPYGIFVQGGGLDLAFQPAMGLKLAGLGSFGPRIFGKALLDGSLTAGFGALATARCAGADASLEVLVKQGLSESRPFDLEAGVGGCIDEERLAMEVLTNLKLGFPAGFGIEGGSEGWISGADEAFEFSGESKVRLPGLPDLNGKQILSDRGIAACGTVAWFSGGWGYRWGDRLPDAFRGCGLSDWGTAGSRAARAAQAAGTTVVVAGDPAYAAFRVTAEGRSPRVRVSGPGGAEFESPADPAKVLLDDRVLIYPEPGRSRTVVVVRAPASGEWRVEALDATGAVTVESALPLPAVRVRGRVSGRGKRRVLRWKATAPAGQEIVFVERGDGVARRIGRSHRSSGRLRFRPSRILDRARRIEAQVLHGGLPRETVTVARFKAPAPRRASRPRKLRARIKRDAIHVRFSGRGTKRWVLTLRRGKLSIDVLLSRRTVRLGDLGWRPSRAAVRAVGPGGHLSRPAKTRVR